MIPSGQHIKGWRHEGNILKGICLSYVENKAFANLRRKVIAERDPLTLQSRGSYFLLFATQSSAQAYEERLAYLHRLARKNTPTGIGPVIYPPPGLIQDGEDVHAALQSYTILAPSSDPKVDRLVSPFRPQLQHLIDTGGYDRIVARGSTECTSVLVQLEPSPRITSSHHVVQRLIAINKVSDRPVPWKLSSDKLAINPLTSFRRAYADNDTDIFDEGGNEPSLRRHVTGWVLTFERAVEARRFVRAWHHQPAPPQPGEDSAEGEEPVVNAVILW